MAMTSRLRPTIPHLRKILLSDAISAHKSNAQAPLICPIFIQSERHYATAPAGSKEVHVKAYLKCIKEMLRNQQQLDNCRDASTDISIFSALKPCAPPNTFLDFEAYLKCIKEMLRNQQQPDNCRDASTDISIFSALKPCVPPNTFLDFEAYLKCIKEMLRNQQQPDNCRDASTGDVEKPAAARLKVPIRLFGGSGNYASALYLAAVKANALDKVEAELNALVEAAKNSPTFAQFTKDLSVPKDTRLKAINDICTQAKLSDVTKNFLVVLAENARLRHIDTIAKRFAELTMAHKGEVKAIVTTVIPLPTEEEKELKDTLQEIIGKGKKVKLEQKVDPSILGGLVVEFEQKVFDMSIRTRAKQMERFLREPVNFDIL